ncbi:Dolichyl-phosphate-mannose-protein mannosyltransferase [Poriferisphaera corsica]|uniref:Dolichyl-phosphate-mannose-protein mannosyltransferase n=1 Tax=Poriferisphaera corsica TaxID=2528020 RepID=A0A517YWB5_9BACT|nr:phospholipid carrier-dependent glycosyltransferase [Poriferisphaera corsica]QDU34518.1 Dolichyl-phosphate-mannose-protein mannosyltransferase [Poriferisphaera corsica]
MTNNALGVIAGTDAREPRFCILRPSQLMPEFTQRNQNPIANSRTMFYGGQWVALSESTPPDQSNLFENDPPSPPPSNGNSRKKTSSHTQRTSRRRDITSPPRRRGKLAMWLLLLTCLTLASIPIFVDINHGSVIEQAEARSIWTSIETYKLIKKLPPDELSLEPFVPVYNTQRQLTEPPAGTWLFMMSFAADDFLGGMHLTSEYILDARIVSAVFALLTVAAVYWIGFSIGGNWLTAIFATAIIISNPTFLYYARLATPDMPTAAFMMLSIAGALWAVRPLRPTAILGRQALGWTFSGLMMGLAILTGGPALIGPIIIPLFVIMLLCPHRASHLLGLLAAILIAALLMTPWIVYVQYGNNPAQWTDWTQTIIPTNLASFESTFKLSGLRLLALIAATTPWLFWFIALLVQPFSDSSAGARLRMFIGWSWFVTVILLLLIRPESQITQPILLILPVFAVALGQTFRQYTDLAATGRYARFWRLMRWPHFAFLLIISAILPIVLFLEPILMKYGYITLIFAEPMHWTYCAALAFMLITLFFLAARAAIRHYPIQAVTFWALWGLVTFTAINVPLVRGPIYVSPIKYNAEQIAYLTSNAQLYAVGFSPSPNFLLYTEREIPIISPEQATELLQGGGQIYILTPNIPPDQAPRGYINRGYFPNADVQLWHGQTRFSQSDTIPLQ